MKENEMIIVPLKVNITKTGKTILHYAIKEETTNYSKGCSVLEHWSPDDKLFNNLKEDDMLKPLKATYEYESTYNGLARRKLTSLLDSNGKNLLV